MSRYAQLPAEVEELVLHLREAGAYPRGNAGGRQQHSDRTVELVHGAKGFNPQAVLGHATAIAQARRPVIAGARVDPAQAIAHGRILSDMASKELLAALEAARAAADVIRAYYRHNPSVRTKSDQTPVTEADVRAEEVIRSTLARAFPGYGFYGEETGQHAMGAESIWLVDPIDGTKAFVREVPFFSKQIALMRGGELVLGVSNAAAYDELAWAERGGGAFLNEQPMRVSAITNLEEASVSLGNFKSLTRPPHWSRLGELFGRVDRVRGYGDFGHYHLLARGSLEVVIESDINILDIAALVVLVREAGGTFTDLSGAAVGLGTTSVLATNGAVHASVLAALTR